MNTCVENGALIQGQRKINIEKILEAICLSIVFLYFFYVRNYVDFQTSFKEYRGWLAGVAIAHALFVMIKKGTYREQILELIFIAIFGKLLVFCASNTYMENFYDIFVLGICVLGIEYKKVMKTVAIAITTSIFASFLCVFTSIIDSNAREYTRTFGNTVITLIRSGWGCGHENALGICCFVALIFFSIGFDKISKLLKGLISLLTALFVWYVPNSRYNAYLLFLFGLVLLIDFVYDSLLCKGAVFKIARKIIEVFALLLTGGIPVIFLYMLLNYEKLDSSIMTKLDDLSSGRLILGYNGYLESGFSLWGQPYNNNTYYLDSGWAIIPIEYGIPMMIFIIGILIYLGIKAFIKDDYLLVWMVLLVSVSGICYELCVYVYYNAFLILPFAKCLKESDSDRLIGLLEHGKLRGFIYKNIGLMCSIAALLLLVTFRKGIISTLQTFMECEKYSTNVSIRVLITFVVLLTLLILSISKCIKNHITQTKAVKTRWLLLTSGVGLLFMFAYGWYSINAVGLHEEAYEEVLADKDAMEILENIDDVTIVPQSEPYLYKKYYGFTDLKWLPTADYARFENMTVIVDARDNYRTLYNTGFVQTPISDYHKIYTNDSRVIAAMESAGYTFTYYSQYVKELDLKQYAKLNKLKWSKKNGLMVKASADGQAITEKLEEDFVDLNDNELKAIDIDGGYTLHVVLNADAGDLANMNPEDTVAHILITAGDQTYLDYRITCGEFVDGTATCDIPFSLWNVNSVRVNTTFTIDEVYNLDFSIQEMSYYRVN